jgi:hypothetical protein
MSYRERGREKEREREREREREGGEPEGRTGSLRIKGRVAIYNPAHGKERKKKKKKEKREKKKTRGRK